MHGATSILDGLVCQSNIDDIGLTIFDHLDHFGPFQTILTIFGNF